MHKFIRFGNEVEIDPFEKALKSLNLKPFEANAVKTLITLLDKVVKANTENDRHKKYNAYKFRVRMRQLGLGILLLRGLLAMGVHNFANRFQVLDIPLLILGLGLICWFWGDKGIFKAPKKRKKAYEDAISAAVAGMHVLDPTLIFVPIEHRFNPCWFALGKEYSFAFRFLPFSKHEFVVIGVNMASAADSYDFVDRANDLDKTVYKIASNL